ncbi:2'-5' RNA ligase family protein [Roseibium algae]|uniref:2'-5' RNA ligase family protein n=1 Tax=Roseibium algae TaxID=3123038 RepID=A0ABU8TQH7_9HYPH
MIYVLAYPEFELSVAERINRFRSANEPERARLVPPHVTLVFGMRNPHPQDFLTHCEFVAGHVSELAVSFMAGDIVYDPFEKTHKLLLPISTGKRTLIALHQQLYDGTQSAKLNPEVPYRPHMTVATHKDRAIIERFDVATLGAFPLFGRIRKIEIVELSDNTLHPLRTIPLRK